MILEITARLLIVGLFTASQAQFGISASVSMTTTEVSEPLPPDESTTTLLIESDTSILISTSKSTSISPSTVRSLSTGASTTGSPPYNSTVIYTAGTSVTTVIVPMPTTSTVPMDTTQESSTNMSTSTSQSTFTTSISTSTIESSTNGTSTTGSSPNNTTAKYTAGTSAATATTPMPTTSTVDMTTPEQHSTNSLTTASQTTVTTSILPSTGDTSSSGIFTTAGTSPNNRTVGKAEVTTSHTERWTVASESTSLSEIFPVTTRFQTSEAETNSNVPIHSTIEKISAETTTPSAEESSTSSNEFTHTQSQADVASTASVIVSSTPGRNCEEGEKVESCTCKGPFAISVDGYCAKPCSIRYVWCADLGTTCQAEEGDNGGFLCTCKVGFFNEGTKEDPSCQSGKFFGGKIEFAETYSEAEATIRNNTIIILNSIYGPSPYYSGCEILEVENGNKVSYELTYKDVDVVNETSIATTFENSTNCTKGETVAYMSYEINCTESIENVVNQDILCDSSNSSFSGECSAETALCNVDQSGFFFCSCKTPATYAKPSPDATSCIKIKCSQDKDCGTAAAGQCLVAADPLDNVCQCGFGFNGENCEYAWQFIFTFVTAVLGILLIIVLIACICQTKSKKKSNHSETLQTDLELKNPFVDFQPGIVRAKDPNILNTVSDLSTPTDPIAQDYDNAAYDSDGYNAKSKSNGHATAQDYY